MKLQVVSPLGELFVGEVTEVIVPAMDGEMGILAGHTPLMAVLNPGMVRFTDLDDQRYRIETGKGFVTVDSDNVMVVVETGTRL